MTAGSSRRYRESDEACVAALARKTHTPIEDVRHLYDEELANLQAKSAVKNFIEVIAARRVRQRLTNIVAPSTDSRSRPLRQKAGIFNA